MAQYATEAVIIGIKNMGEADKAVTLLSPEKGRIQAIAFGCRRTKSPLAGALQMFNQVDIQLSEGDHWDTVRQCSVKTNYKIMTSDFVAMAYGSFVAEITGRLSIEKFPQQDMYQKLLEILGAFGSRNPRIVALAAAYQLLEYSGMQLMYEHCVCCNQEMTGDGWFSLSQGGALCPKCSGQGNQGNLPYPQALQEFLLQLIDLDWQQEPSFRVSGKVLLAAEDLMLQYLHHIFERPMKSLQFIQQIG